MSEPDWGDLAEQKIRILATSAGYTVTRVESDRTGWDLLMESRTRADQVAAPFDAEPAPPAFKVQVKALVAKDKRSVKIKLDHWKRHSEEPIPHFIAGLVQTPTEPEELFLRHVDRVLVERVQKRLFEAEENPPFHKQTMQFTFDETDNVDLAPAAFRSAVEGSIGEVATYPMRKLGWAKNAGYEERPISVRMVLKAEAEKSDVERMVDFAIGHQEKLLPKSLKVERVRFGKPTRIEDYGDGEVELFAESPSVGEAKLTFTARDGSASTTLTVQLFHSRVLLPMLEDEHHKLRFANANVDLVYQPSRNKADYRWRFSGEEPLDMATAGPCAVALGIIARGASTMLLTLDDGRTQRWELEGQTLGADALECATTIGNAWWILERFGLGTSVRASLASLERQDSIFALVRFVLSSAQTESIGFEMSGPFEDGQRVAVPLVQVMGFAEKRLGVIVVATGVARPTGRDRFQMRDVKGRSFKFWVWTDGDELPDWQTAREDLISELETDPDLTVLNI